ncbi:MAG: SDR family oxidoreductase [Xanthomonadales bacterium]|nr:3-oxoacyl-[acyl-carrier-protein] reductase FabG [Xanthomonadales bacterium]MCC6594785.1 SDR family oxidoreductase [Xanthomonadales bacterium]MCE7929960.1 SDR family oxidoreductase [Xanthomonadales bacterium PRO6]
MKRRMLITGASAGIGEACAHEWARRGWNLLLTARRTDRLQTLADTLKAEHGCDAVVIAADLADPLAPVQLTEAIEARGLQVDGLINNAGYGVPGTLLSVPWRTHADFLRVLLWAPTELTYLLLPGMQQRGFGRIVNVASLAGLVPGTAGHTLYGATKSYLIRFSQSLAQETLPRGVHVTALCPGFTYSEFHDVNQMRATVSKMPKFMWMDAQTVARQAFEASERGDIVYVNGRWNRFVRTLTKVLPDRLALALVSRQSRKFRRI